MIVLKCSSDVPTELREELGWRISVDEFKKFILLTNYARQKVFPPLMLSIFYYDKCFYHSGIH